MLLRTENDNGWGLAVTPGLAFVSSIRWESYIENTRVYESNPKQETRVISNSLRPTDLVCQVRWAPQNERKTCHRQRLSPWLSKAPWYLLLARLGPISVSRTCYTRCESYGGRGDEGEERTGAHVLGCVKLQASQVATCQTRKPRGTRLAGQFRSDWARPTSSYRQTIVYFTGNYMTA